MKYVCLGYFDEAKFAGIPPADAQRMMEDCFAYDDELRRGGHFVGGEALDSARNAVTLRMKEGKVAVTDGPFVETKETLGGILLLEARDLDHAISLMSKHPGVKIGPFEIRPANEVVNQMFAERAAAVGKPTKNTICLWYDGGAEDAARLYARTFPDSSVGAVHRAPGDFPSGKKGDVLTVEFTVMGIPCLGVNGGPVFKHNEAFSFQVATADQAETDHYWNAIIGNGGEESQCGWCKDKWGLSWQITPVALTKAITDPDPAAAQRAFQAMMQMKKIDIAAIEAARRGGR
ncbi:MAG: VOC family protein [Planctomycetia bacterium]|nr:VOC family protein [Planctomycetia bacterium]